MMDLRTLISAIALATVCARSGAFAQQQRSWRVGFVALPERPEPLEGSRFGAFALGMRELGYIERRTLTIEWRFAGGEVDRLAELAAEVVQRKVDIIVAGETPVISAAQKATATIPIVMAASNDPVGSGFVESLGRPGHNITGVSILSTDLSGKLVEMLQSVAPTATRVTGQPVEAATAEGIEQAFARMRRQDASAVVIAADSFFVEQREQIAQLALKHRLPSIFSFREHVQAGGLISYGQHLADSYRRAATYVDRIFNGAKPSELPVELSTRLELIVNLKTAKALGLTVPDTVL